MIWNRELEQFTGKRLISLAVKNIAWYLFYRPDGWKYEGEFSNDKKHGPGKLTTPEGDIMKGEWSEDERLKWLWGRMSLVA